MNQLIGLPELFTVLKAVFQFPWAIFQFVTLLQKTPQEKHEDILKKISEEAKRFEETGRPTWD